MLILLVGCLWLVLIAYVLWFLFKAKTVQPLTIDALALTWRVHKKQNGCTASRIHSLIKENDEIVGFRCECGYKFIQKRLISQRPNAQKIPPILILKQIPNSWKTALFVTLKRAHMSSMFILLWTGYEHSRPRHPRPQIVAEPPVLVLDLHEIFTYSWTAFNLAC
jgi:hypothetical protein